VLDAGSWHGHRARLWWAWLAVFFGCWMLLVAGTANAVAGGGPGGLLLLVWLLLGAGTGIVVATMDGVPRYSWVFLALLTTAGSWHRHHACHNSWCSPYSWWLLAGGCSGGVTWGWSLYGSYWPTPQLMNSSPVLFRGWKRLRISSQLLSDVSTPTTPAASSSVSRDC